MKRILEYCEDELVSVDFRGNPHSSILDAGYTRVVGDQCVKVLSWYDNEWGYACRCVDLIRFMGAKI
jgi:glyceraldehyde 3-phosphate dehydrogenase